MRIALYVSGALIRSEMSASLIPLYPSPSSFFLFLFFFFFLFFINTYEVSTIVILYMHMQNISLII